LSGAVGALGGVRPAADAARAAASAIAKGAIAMTSFERC
jgi:hypothetical protein